MDVFIGTIVPWPISYAPPYFSLCWGAQFPVNQYQAVFSLIGAVFGGNTTVFNLPDLRGRTVVGVGNFQNSTPVYQMGQWSGNANSTFTIGINQIPAHVHPANFTPVVAPQNVTLPSQNVSIPGQTVAVPAANTSLYANVAVPLSTVGNGTIPAAGSTNILTYSGSGMSKVGVYTSANAPTGPSLVPFNAPVAGTDGMPAHNVTIPAVNTTLPAQTVTINAVSNGCVTVGPGGPQTAQQPMIINNMQPYLAMNFLFAMQGLYPMRP